MFGFVKKVSVVAMTFVSCNALECVSMTNQGYRARSQIMNINHNEPSFYPYGVKWTNSVVVVIISMIHMQNYVFLTLLKT